MTKLREFAIFIAFSLALSCISMPLLIVFGPFPKVRRMLGESALTTMRHRSWAKYFLSDEEIEKYTQARFNTYKTEASNRKLSNVSKDHRVELFDVEGRRFKGKVVVVHDPMLMRVGYSDRLPESGETVSQMASRENALAAVNAGGFGDYQGTGTGGWPEGVIIHKGKFIYSAARNPDTEVRIIGFTKEGVLVAGTSSLRKLKKMGVREGVSFGPVLVSKGRGLIEEGDGGWGIAPRSGIGQTKDGKVIMVVLDGRQVHSIGATLKDLQNVFLEYGAYTAVNLDGGSSATLYYKGKVVNSPSDPMGERFVPTSFLAVPPGVES